VIIKAASATMRFIGDPPCCSSGGLERKRNRRPSDHRVGYV
jgi:hypothetical protein